MNELKPGVYRLTEDVVNPVRDKRKTDVWNAEKFKAGTKFIYEEFVDTRGKDDVPFTDKRLHILYRYGDARPNTKQWDAIVPKLMPIPESFETWLIERWHSPSDSIPARELFSKLGEMGRLTLKDLKEAWSEVEHDREIEWEREQRAKGQK
jgi:hypothetical protein